MSHADDIIRGYSPKVIKRLLTCLKPYKPAATITLMTLAVATAAELLAPLVMQRALDDHVLRRDYRLELTAIEAGIPDRKNADLVNLQGIRIGESLFVPTRALRDLNEQAKEEARNRGWLDRYDWYLFPAGDTAADEVVMQNTRLFISSDEWHAIRIADRRDLTTEEKRSIRRNDVLGLGRRSGQYAILMVSILVFTFFQVYVASWIGQKVMADMRGGLLSHIMRQSLGYLGKTSVGSLVSRTANDVETIAEFFTNAAISLLKDVAVMGGVIGVLFALDNRLAWISMITLLPIFVLIVVFRNRMREAFRRVRSRVSAVNAFLSERINGMSTLQLFDAEKRSAAEFDVKGNGLLDAEMDQMRIMAVFRPLIDMVASVAVALVIWYSSNLHHSELISLGVLIAFVELIQKFFQPAKDIAEKFNILQSAMVGGERIFAIMDEVDRIPDQGEEKIDCDDTDHVPVAGSVDSRGVIRFENVHFSYVPGEPVLRGLNFSINPGHTVAVVGATGAGKTTIANLITRLWDPNEGRILLDGKDIRQRSLADLRRTVQPVQQDVFLFSGTIAENIDLGLGLDRLRILDAARLARADAFISRLPESYDTEVTEGAGNLSAGERQLIAFARIIAHDPRIIILDEATANVDTETETLLQEGLDILLKDRTALIISHRLSTIRKADRILVLGHGKLIEDGIHDELLAKGGVYHNLYKLQFAEAVV